MREEGYVSLWLGVAPTIHDLEQYVALTYNEEGELVPSQFMEDFELQRWEEDCREADFLGEVCDSVAEVLSDFSYDSQLIKQFQRILGKSLTFPVNAAVLLYNFNHQSLTATESDGVVQLRFMGVVKYLA